jgi:hypothetical protein
MRASFAFLVGICLFAVAAPAQQAGHIGLPVDWSFRHIVSHAAAAGRQRDPRAIYNALRYLRGREQTSSAAPAGQLPPRGRLRRKPATPKAHGDWHFPLGNGTMAANAGATTNDQSPAKFSFDINAAPDCSNDYVVYTLNVAGSPSQPNIVGFNNLYAGASASQQNIVKASETGTTATITTQAAHGFTVGRKVIIDGVPVNGYNGTFTITAVTSTTFSYKTTSGLATLASGGGTATQTNTISSASESGSTVTVTTAAAHGLSAGSYVTVEGVTPAGYNGVFPVTSAPTTTTFTYTAATTGLTAGSGGSATGSGLCGLTPGIKFAYNASTTDAMTASPVISLDGAKVAFVGTSAGGSNFYVLTLPTTGSSGSWDATSNQYAAVVPGAADDASVSSYSYSSNANSFGSSPYIDYSSDVAYFGDDAGNIYKTTCVFLCAQNGITLGTASGWPVNLSASQLSSPVIDLNTGMLFVGGVDGNLYSCNVSSCATTVKLLAIGNGGAFGGIIDGPILDNGFGTLIVTSGGSAASNAFTIVQLDESLNKIGSVATGAQAFPVPNGALSDEYYNNAFGNTSAAGFGYFCGPTGGSGQAVIYTVPFTQPSRTIGSATESGTTVTITTTLNHGFTAGDTVVISGVPVAGYNGPFTIVSTPTSNTFTVTNATTGLANSSGGSAVQQQLTATNPPTFGTATTLAIAGANKATCGPFTILTNTTERLFFSQPSAPCPSGPAHDGCAFAYSINTGTGLLTQVATSDQHSGTSGMVVDNISTSPQASSLYFATESKAGPNATSAPSCTYGTAGTAGYCAVKLTQSTLQ